MNVYRSNHIAISRRAARACAVTMLLLGAAAQAPAAEIALLPRLTASATDLATTLPDADDTCFVGDSFVVEVWAQTDEGQGLSSVSLDLSFDTSVQVTGIVPTALMNVLAHGVVDNVAGMIDDLSGSHLGPCDDAVGVAPTWARVAVLECHADTAGSVVFHSAAPSSRIYGTAICGVGDVDPGSITYGQHGIDVEELGVPAISHTGMALLTCLIVGSAVCLLRLRHRPARVRVRPRRPD